MICKHLAIAGLGGLAILLTTLPHFHPIVPGLVYNPSASEPIGYYKLRPVGQLKPGDIVVAQTPESVRQLADQRHYLPKSVPMLKTVAALAGDEVCASGRGIWINRNAVADRLAADHLGRPLPTWEGCHRLGTDDVFLLNPDAPNSFDGRYFGVVKAASIVAQACRL